MVGIPDNLHQVFNRFNLERTQRKLHDRFPGHYRAVVVETNDPLNMHRVRFKCPELHNFDLKPEECPFAVTAFEHGGKGTGSWSSPTIGDIIWVSFEKQHPYGPIWTGHAEPTRRRFYKLHATYQKPNIYVDEEGKSQGEDSFDWDPDYLPKDGRPYSQGLKDRYGTMFVMDATGFFPDEHKDKPAPNGSDAITESTVEFKENKEQPKANDPDSKMVAYITKVGHYFIIADMGYKWDEEFKGEFEEDYDDEKKRINNIKKLLHEDEAKTLEEDNQVYDQRRIEMRTDYGHKLEMRDVGYAAKGGYAAQSGKVESKGRENDFFEKENKKSDWDEKDQRWVKYRTKGGMLMQFMDMGFHPQEDTFVRRNRLEEIAGDVDKEDDEWQERDARQMRFITRYGFKFVLDDRGTDEKEADEKEEMHGNGWLLKGRRYAAWDSYQSGADSEDSPGRTIPQVSGGSPAYSPKFGEQSDPKGGRGFGIDVNEKNDLNRMLLYTPMSKALELNDRFGYVFLTTDMKQAISREWKYKSENEFATSICMGISDPEENTYSLKLDRSNAYNSLTTPMDQTFEARDGWVPTSEAFVEARDYQGRATVMSEELKLSSIHDHRQLQYLVLKDDSNVVLLHNKGGSKLQIYCVSDIEIISDADIKFTCQNYTVNCQKHVINAGGGQHVVDSSRHGSTVDLFAPNSNAFHVGCLPGPGAGPSSPQGDNAPSVSPDATPKLIPTNRKKKANQPYSDVSEEVIKDVEQL